MACTENIPPANGDSEMEEGEIVDELDDLSDISSEEEFLLRQRLQVLESYNNVLERKNAKKVRPGHKGKETFLPQDLSDISATDNEDTFTDIRVIRKSNEHLGKQADNEDPFTHITITTKCDERLNKQKRKKVPVGVTFGKSKDTKKKPHRLKKKLPPKVVPDSSEESDDEYRNKRRKLANAVKVHTPKNDSTSLKARLRKMFGTQSQGPTEHIQESITKPESEPHNVPIDPSTKSEDVNKIDNKLEVENKKPEVSLENPTTLCELIDLCDDDQVIIIENNMPNQDTVDGIMGRNETAPRKQSSGDSDEDLELLRQHALKTKSTKTKTEEQLPPEPETKPITISEDEDSDTAELRLICLKSALLKKAIEMKQKQKMRKRLSQSIQEDFNDENISKKVETENNTDIESVDMDIGSDGEEKLKEISNHCNSIENMEHGTRIINESHVLSNIPSSELPQKDEIEEDEDLLRAKLLTSLSKNLPNLVDANVLAPQPEAPTLEFPIPGVPVPTVKNKTALPDEKPFIIKLGESDSDEGEHEATKNLTKMHMKLSEQIDFQEKLDLFLKSTRKEVEKQTLPDVVQQPPEQPKPVSKFVAKTVRHLPKSEQIEYKQLVKRMAELEKFKQARQSSMNLNKSFVQIKDTLKPRNVSFETPNNVTINNLEEQIAVSRKKIAEESAKMLKLKDEATKLSQKYKIVATELKNIATAITLNKKEQRSVQSRLTKIRLQHQTLIKSSPSNKHSKTNLPNVNLSSNKISSSTKLQKENNPSKEEILNLQLLKSVKVSVVNDLKEVNASNQRLSVQVDVSSNKKVVKIPKNPPNERIVDVTRNEFQTETFNPIVKKSLGSGRNSKDNEAHTIEDLNLNVKKSGGSRRNSKDNEAHTIEAVNPIVNKSGGNRRSSRDYEVHQTETLNQIVKKSGGSRRNSKDYDVHALEAVNPIVKKSGLNRRSSRDNEVHHTETLNPTVRKSGGSRRSSRDIEVHKHVNNIEMNNKDVDDYKSPLEALQSGNWEVDPNSFLCPYEVGGTCKDSACKYLHPKIPSVQ